MFSTHDHPNPRGIFPQDVTDPGPYQKSGIVRSRGTKPIKQKDTPPCPPKQPNDENQSTELPSDSLTDDN
jgi:hypothetical protein